MGVPIVAKCQASEQEPDQVERETQVNKHAGGVSGDNMRLQIAIIIVVAGLLLMAGTGLSQETKQAPPAPIDVKKADLNQEVWNPDWDGVGDIEVIRLSWSCQAENPDAEALRLTNEAKGLLLSNPAF